MGIGDSRTYSIQSRDWNEREPQFDHTIIPVPINRISVELFSSYNYFRISFFQVKKDCQFIIIQPEGRS